MENHLIDGLIDGRVSRREFVRHGSLLGLSLPLIGGIATAAGFSTMTTKARAQAKAGGTIRIACTVPIGAIDPVTVSDPSGGLMLQQVGEYLCLDDADLVLRPMLAESWKANADGTLWTFTLRKGVKFHNGAEMKADDVVASINRLADPANGSNALSVFSGVIQKGAARKVDDYTVEFHLDSPNGSFPYLVSSDNYNAIILPSGYAGDFEKHFIGTGPFKIDSYNPKVSASFVKNSDYWGGQPALDRTEFVFFDNIQAQVLALQGGQVDVISQLPVLAGVSILNDASFDVISLRAATHQQLHMRTDVAPFNDPRVRRAIALCLDRNKLVNGLMKGRAELGNDSPFAPVYPSTDQSVPQRHQDIAQAKQLMEAAGVGKGFKATLTTEYFLEIPEYAQLVQSWVKEIGIDLTLNILDQGAYYGDAVFGKSNWLDSTMGITDFGHRGVPNVLLSAAFKSDGTWNAAHFKNAEFDQLATSYIASLDLESRKQASSKMQILLLDQTPVIFSYFFNFITATTKGVTGVQPNAMSLLYLQGASRL